MLIWLQLIRNLRSQELRPFLEELSFGFPFVSLQFWLSRISNTWPYSLEVSWRCGILGLSSNMLLSGVLDLYTSMHLSRSEVFSCKHFNR